MPLIGSVHEDGVLVLKLGNGVAHPLSLAMIRAIHQAVEEPGEARVILLHGPGKIFCAGHDLKEIARHRGDADAGRGYLEELFGACAGMMLAIVQSPLPVIGVCEGIATAGGLQLLASCDLAFGSTAARFCLPGVSNGGFCTTPAVAVGRAIGARRTMELALSGEVFDAQWGREAGLVNRVLPDNELMPFAMDFARTLAGRHAPAVQAGKRGFREQMGMPLDEAYIHATEIMIGHFMDPERVRRDLDRWA